MQVLPGNGEIIQTLRRMPKLQAFERKDLRRLLSCSRIVRYEPGEIITREDEPDPGIFFLVSGRVRVSRNGVEIKVLARTGDIFGEMRLLNTSANQSSVQAVETTVCLVTDTDSLERIRKEDRVAFAAIYYMVMAEVLARRLKETSDELERVRGELVRLKATSILHDVAGQA